MLEDSNESPTMFTDTNSPDGTENSSGSSCDINVPHVLAYDKFDMAKMREKTAHWVLMHEHPFSIVEEEGFNSMLRCGIPQWENITCTMVENDCVAVYENEKKKLKAILKNVNKISLTTDLWRSSDEMIEYMVLTGHFVDSDWRLQKHVLSFVHISPPCIGVQIVDSVYKCLKEWDIEDKVFTISMDNASNNDAAIRILKDNFSITKKLPCGGKLFHVRCCAHILNLLVQDGLSQIKYIVEDIHNSVAYVNKTASRLITFSEIVQHLQLPNRKLILDYTTRWNSTYEMMATAVKFKDVFLRFKEREPGFTCCPKSKDWEKLEKFCEVLRVFSRVTNLISGNEYPTSNLFLIEVYRVKVMLDKKAVDENELIRETVKKMKEKFDKYWEECNLVISIAAVLDPRYKMRFIDYFFPQMYPEAEARANIIKVRDVLYELYGEYVNEFESSKNDRCAKMDIDGQLNVGTADLDYWDNEFEKFMMADDNINLKKSDLDCYLEEGLYICKSGPNTFDALQWWKRNNMKYPILSRMARDILAIPITTVTSEATFSAGSRVIDTYRESLSSDIVQVLLCGGDWCRNLNGVRIKKEEDTMEIHLPID